MHLLHVVSTGEWGGAERYAFDICRYFKARGWDVGVLTRDTAAVDRAFVREEIRIHHAPLRRRIDPASVRALAKCFKAMERGKGVVHVHTGHDALNCIIARRIARRPDIRLVATRHTAGRVRDGLLRRITCRGIDSFLFVSEFSRNEYCRCWEGRTSAPLDKSKTAITYNSLFRKREESLEEPERGPVSAAYRGGLKPGKGLETLIDALALLKDCRIRLRLMGKGNPDYVDTLRQRALRAGVADRIDWTRHTDFAEEALKKVHFGVLPSEEPEAFGMANMEFMACGKAQISTFTGAQGELLRAGTDALEVAPGDSEALAAAIRSLATDPELRSRMGREAFQRYTTAFAWPHFIKRLIPHYIR